VDDLTRDFYNGITGIKCRMMDTQEYMKIKLDKYFIFIISCTAARLQPFGAGPTSPAASNQTEEGRAKNRRVELVAQ
jgi:hypothetical protein